MDPDPGGIFASDTHRRVLAHLPVPGGDPTSVEDLAVRVAPDAFTNFDSPDELEDVLLDLEGDGHAGNTKAGWKQTKKGADALNGPIANEPESES